jgi:pSer/pThr/pTyr-binding forkhead associated (FHA) protein
MPSIHLVIVEGPDTGRRFEVAGVTVLGRDPSAGIVLGDIEVSRRHAAVATEDDGALIHDLGSTNGTFVNGERVEETRIGEGDRLKVGKTVLELRPLEAVAPGEREAETVPREVPPDLPPTRIPPADLPPTHIPDADDS